MDRRTFLHRAAAAAAPAAAIGSSLPGRVTGTAAPGRRRDVADAEGAGRPEGDATAQSTGGAAEPTDFAIVCKDLSTSPRGVETRVTANLDVLNNGIDPEAVVILESNGSVVARERQEIHRMYGDSDWPCRGRDVSISKTLLGFGSRDLRVRVEPAGDEGEGDTADLGSIEAGNPFALAGLGAAGAATALYRRALGEDGGAERAE